jgi:hypothetical protein
MAHLFGATTQWGAIEGESAVILDYPKRFAYPVKICVNYPVTGSFHTRLIIRDSGGQLKKKQGRLLRRPLSKDSKTGQAGFGCHSIGRMTTPPPITERLSVPPNY